MDLLQGSCEAPPVKHQAELVKLVSADDQVFEVDPAVAHQSQALREYVLLEPGPAGSFPVSNVTGSTLARVLDYCKQHAGARPPEDIEVRPGMPGMSHGMSLG